MTFWDFFDAHYWTVIGLFLMSLGAGCTTAFFVAGVGGLGLLARTTVNVENSAVLDNITTDDEALH